MCRLPTLIPSNDGSTTRSTAVLKTLHQSNDSYSFFFRALSFSRMKVRFCPLSPGTFRGNALGG